MIVANSIGKDELIRENVRKYIGSDYTIDQLSPDRKIDILQNLLLEKNC